MSAETAVSVLIPLVVLVVLWTVLRHWILPFVLGFALAVALGPSARPLLAGAWGLVANAGDALFGAPGGEEDPGRWYPPERRPERYDPQ
jgi:hypothetical protein